MNTQHKNQKSQEEKVKNEDTLQSKCIEEENDNREDATTKTLEKAETDSEDKNKEVTEKEIVVGDKKNKNIEEGTENVVEKANKINDNNTKKVCEKEETEVMEKKAEDKNEKVAEKEIVTRENKDKNIEEGTGNVAEEANKINDNNTKKVCEKEETEVVEKKAESKNEKIAEKEIVAGENKDKNIEEGTENVAEEANKINDNNTKKVCEKEETEVVEKKAEDKNEKVCEKEIVAGENKDKVETAKRTSKEEQKQPATLADKFRDKDFNKFSLEKLIATLKLLLDEGDITAIKDLVTKIQSSFYSKHNEDKQVAKDAFIAEGGVPENFQYKSTYEDQFRALIKKYGEKKAAYNKQQEYEKEFNLEKKYAIIESIKNLITKQESLSDTFKEFHKLQDEWRSIGLVPLSKVNEIWRNYHHNVENFYDYIRINKELRDLDFKKNLDIKTKLLEEAKQLVNEKSVKKSFDTLQKLHNKWKEAGPVKRELREPLWLEFKEASRSIHKRHQDFFINLKNEQKENLTKKEAICEKVEMFLESAPNNNQEWNRIANEIKNLQSEWKSIGFAPKKYNQAIYDRFRKICDTFFEKKRNAYKEQRKEFKTNLDKKVQLCEMAEAVMDSNDWKMTTDYLIELQKQWKQVGAVQYKYSQKVWDRFRKACNHFFDRRSTKTISISDDEQADNLEKKQEIIKKLEGLKVTEGDKHSLTTIQRLQAEFYELGFVPIAEKDRINNELKQALEKLFNTINITEEERGMQEFIGKYTLILDKPDGENQVVKERLKLASKVKQIENNIVVWGNNIGFFSNSSNAEKLISEVEEKINKGKDELKGYYKKLRFLDKLLQ